MIEMRHGRRKMRRLAEIAAAVASSRVKFVAYPRTAARPVTVSMRLSALR